MTTLSNYYYYHHYYYYYCKTDSAPRPKSKLLMAPAQSALHPACPQVPPVLAAGCSPLRTASALQAPWWNPPDPLAVLRPSWMLGLPWPSSCPHCAQVRPLRRVADSGGTRPDAGHAGPVLPRAPASLPLPHAMAPIPVAIAPYLDIPAQPVHQSPWCPVRAHVPHVHCQSLSACDARVQHSYIYTH